MSGVLAVGGNVEQALEAVGVPSYVLDKTGVVRWINPAAAQIVGDVRGRHFTSVVAPEDRPRALELFTSKVLGTVSANDTTGVLVSTKGHARPWRSAPFLSGAASGSPGCSGCSWGRSRKVRVRRTRT